MVSYAYDSWGKVTAIEGDQDLGKKNPLRYRGYYWDEETGLYYLASRYYDPEVGRFINADDLSVLSEEKREITDKNLYAYCNNNPIIRKDNEGDMCQLALAGVGGNGFGTMTNPIAKRYRFNSRKKAKQQAMIIITIRGD